MTISSTHGSGGIEIRAKFERNIEAENKIYNYVLKYLEKTYGVKHLKRPYPTNKNAKLFLAKDVLIPKILKDLYGLSKWDGKKVGIHSQALRDEYLVSILTNFGEYRKNLISASKMSKQNKKDYQNNLPALRKHYFSLHKEAGLLSICADFLPLLYHNSLRKTGRDMLFLKAVL